MTVADLFPPMDEATRTRIKRDLEQFAAIAPTLGRAAVYELPTFGGVHRAIRDRVIEALKAEPAAPLDQKASAALAAMFRGARCIDVTARYRRDRIRRAARARKSRRGW